MSAKLLEQAFKSVYGNPSWFVRQRYGASIAFEFGQPHLDIRKKILQPSKKTRRKYAIRMVRVHGDWHFTTFYCDWKLRQSNRKICDSDSRAEKIDRGCVILNGQILTQAIVNPKNLATDFYFDLGGHLQTRPFKKEDEPSSMWDLFCPDKRVFSLRSDGFYSFEHRKTPPDKKRWSPFTFDLQ